MRQPLAQDLQRETCMCASPYVFRQTQFFTRAQTGLCAKQTSAHSHPTPTYTSPIRRTLSDTQCAQTAALMLSTNSHGGSCQRQLPVSLVPSPPSVNEEKKIYSPPLECLWKQHSDISAPMLEEDWEGVIYE